MVSPIESALSNDDEELQIRLQKFLAAAGFGSRRKCEEYITDGRVTIDGQPATDLGVKVDPRSQTVAVDGERIKQEKKKYYVLHKPPGYVCTNHDPGGRPKAVDLIGDDARLFSVGRLDENSLGLLLITNDGELANRLAHPRYAVPRRYQVQVAGKPTAETFKQLREGVWFNEGKFFVNHIERVRGQGNSTILEIELRQGRNREIRRLFARVGHKVMKLQRVTFGPVKLGNLGMGKYRPLRESELEELKKLVQRQKANRSGGSKQSSGGNRKPSGKKAGGRKPSRNNSGSKRSSMKSSGRRGRRKP